MQQSLFQLSSRTRKNSGGPVGSSTLANEQTVYDYDSGGITSEVRWGLVQYLIQFHLEDRINHDCKETLAVASMRSILDCLSLSLSIHNH